MMMSSSPPLASALDAEWILREPCVVKWEDSNHELRTLGLEPHLVILWIGMRKTDRIWVAILQRTITFEYSCRPKPFHFFMFLDPRDLRVEKHPTTGKSYSGAWLLAVIIISRQYILWLETEVSYLRENYTKCHQQI
jgi:hypothetical protein